MFSRDILLILVNADNIEYDNYDYDDDNDDDDDDGGDGDVGSVVVIDAEEVKATMF